MKTAEEFFKDKMKGVADEFIPFKEQTMKTRVLYSLMQEYAEYYLKQQIEEKLPSDTEQWTECLSRDGGDGYELGWDMCFDWLKSLLTQENNNF